jgi:hypothetical protein
VRQTVGKGRPVVEDPLLGTLLGTLRNRRPERVIRLPERENLLFDGGKRRRGYNVVARMTGLAFRCVAG